MREVVGGFFRTCTDDSIAELRAQGAATAASSSASCSCREAALVGKAQPKNSKA